MKVFGINFGSSSDSGLTPNQLILRAALLPSFKAARTDGFPMMELGKALHNHFERTKEIITTERAKALLADPESLIFAYRKATNRSTAPTDPQIKAINKPFAAPEERAKAQKLLADNFVSDLLPMPRFLALMKQLQVAEFVPTPVQIQQWRNRKVQLGKCGTCPNCGGQLETLEPSDMPMGVIPVIGCFHCQKTLSQLQGKGSHT
jgi:hypothetical protein